MRELENTVAVVTGGGRGIGRAIAMEMASEGASVAVLGRDLSTLGACVADIESIGGRALALSCDVVEPDAVQGAFAEIERAFGSVDTLINNAGRFGHIGPVWEDTSDEVWRDIEVNLRGTLNTIRCVLPAMREGRKGYIINLIGGGVVRPLPAGPGYSTAKTAVLRLSECLAVSLQGSGVTVIPVAPGLVRTDMTERQLQSLEGKRHLAGVAHRFESGDDLEPTVAARLCAEIAKGQLDALHGRVVSAWDDLDTLKKTAAIIQDSGNRVLTLPGFDQALKPLRQD